MNNQHFPAKPPFGHCHPMPPFCPPPEPVPPCNPPEPSVVEGSSLYQAVNNLTNRVNSCINVYNNVMANCYETLRNLEQAAQENGSYYGPCDVWTEEGYLADQSAAYTLIHKNAVDRRNEPIFMQLHLAYNNTTNSMVSQNLASASKIEYADKIFPAQPIRKSEEGIQLGWYGNVIYQGAPIQTSDEPNLYTVGFTRSGLMRVYNNGVSVDQMLRDTIENAMGCPGVLIQNGQVTDVSWYNTIPNYDQQTARVVMGQNTETREVIILVCGNENNVNKKGMTSQAAANILLQYGCTIAVELVQGASAAAMDKGSLMFAPENDSIPDAYCFWYITRSRFYCNDYERELAELMQNYGATIWQAFLNKKRIDGLKSALDQEILDRTQGDANLTDAINAEQARAEEAEKNLQENINAETNRAEEAEKLLQENINALAAKLEPILTDIENLNSQYQQLMKSMAELDATVAAHQQTIAAIESAINEIKQTISQIQQQLIDFNNRYLSLTGGTMSGAIDMGGNPINNLPEPEGADQAATKSYVDNAVKDISFDKYLPLAGGTMVGPINMNSRQINNVKEPTSGGDAVNKDYLETQLQQIPLEDYLSRSGGNMTGNIAMNQSKVTGLPTPSSSGDAVNKAYVDQIDADLKNLIAASSGDYEALQAALKAYVLKAGDQMTGNLNIKQGTQNLDIGSIPVSSNQNSAGIASAGDLSFKATGAVKIGTGDSFEPASVQGIATPTQPNDAANKQYVDDKIADVPTPDLSGYYPKSGGQINGNVTIGPDGVASRKLTFSTGSGVTAGFQATPAGDLQFNASSSKGTITDIPVPESNSDVANKLYVDQTVAAAIPETTASADKLTTARNINGTPFDGSKNITTAYSYNYIIPESDYKNVYNIFWRYKASNNNTKRGCCVALITGIGARDTINGIWAVSFSNFNYNTGIHLPTITQIVAPKLGNLEFGYIYSPQTMVFELGFKYTTPDSTGGAITITILKNETDSVPLMALYPYATEPDSWTALTTSVLADQSYVDQNFDNNGDIEKETLSWPAMTTDDNTYNGFPAANFQVSKYGTSYFINFKDSFALTGLPTGWQTKSIWLTMNWKLAYSEIPADNVTLQQLWNDIKQYGSHVTDPELATAGVESWDYQGIMSGCIYTNNGSQMANVSITAQITRVSNQYMKLRIQIPSPYPSSIAMSGMLLQAGGNFNRCN